MTFSYSLFTSQVFVIGYKGLNGEYGTYGIEGLNGGIVIVSVGGVITVIKCGLFSSSSTLFSNSDMRSVHSAFAFVLLVSLFVSVLGINAIFLS